MASQNQLKWVRASNGGTVTSAVLAGLDSNNHLFIIRANHNGGVIPGKLHRRSPPDAFISYDGKEIFVADYEVLVAPSAALSWVESSGGNIPALAVVGGTDPNGDILYIGRVIHAAYGGKTVVTVGKVHPRYNACYIPYDGKEIRSTAYEILVVNYYGKHLGINPKSN